MRSHAAHGARIVSVISDQAESGALAFAKAEGLNPRLVPAPRGERASFERALLEALAEAQADLILLLGFMRIVSADFIALAPAPLLNLHPSLLPAHRGLQTHQRVIDAGDPWHGATIHKLAAAVDAGTALTQVRLAVAGVRDAERLAMRVQQLEHRLVPATVALIAAGLLDPQPEPPRFRSQPLAGPLHLDPQTGHWSEVAPS